MLLDQKMAIDTYSACFSAGTFSRAKLIRGWSFSSRPFKSSAKVEIPGDTFSDISSCFTSSHKDSTSGTSFPTPKRSRKMGGEK